MESSLDRSALLRAAFACGVAFLAACSTKSPVMCTSMDAPSMIVTSAVVFRVDVYSTSSHCTDPGGPSGTPVLTRSFAQGQPITLDVSAGHRPVLLVAYGDTEATLELGRACSEADFGQGQKVCLDLHVVAMPDLSPMLSCADDSSVCGTGACCDKLCWDPASDIAHCGGCRTCSAAQVAGPLCEGGLCRSSCISGFGNCVQPAAPAVDDGCETDLTTSVASCGACGRACSTVSTDATSCAGGLCTSTCQPGFDNCTKPAPPADDDGCETATSSSIVNCGGCARACSTDHVQTAMCSGGVCTSTCTSGRLNCAHPTAPTADDGCECTGTACCGTSCQTTHNNGLGNTFVDCAAPNTHNDTEAQAARAAWPVVLTSDFSSTACTNSAPMECRQTLTSCACWGYSTGANNPGDGHVHLNSASNGCICPAAGDPTWN